MHKLDTLVAIQHGNSYLAEGVFLTWGARFAHAQQSPIPWYRANSQAITRHNKLNNYDIIDTHCTVPSKMKLIYGLKG